MPTLSCQPNMPDFDATSHSFNVTTTAAAEGGRGGGGGGGDVMLLLEETPNQKKPSSFQLSPSCCAQVVRTEIAWLELEILHLERHLLSLYRKAYQQQQQHLLVLPTHEDYDTDKDEDNGSSCSREYTSDNYNKKTVSSFQVIPSQSLLNRTKIQDLQKGRSPLPSSNSRNYLHPSLKPYALGGSDTLGEDAASHPVSKQALRSNLGVNGQLLLQHPCTVKEQEKEKENAVDHHRANHSHILADHLGSSSCSNSTPDPDRLSEDIVKCISSICCKLANPVPSNHIQIGIKAGSSNSSNSSLSSSSLSTFDRGIVYDDDKWSPLCTRRRPYYGAIQVSKISCVDTDDTFRYAAKMLEKLRSLVKRLEKVNPTKMKREEKLSFWINIHNALVMHANLAYGTQDRVKSSSVFKAAYNVGGRCVNAYIIQSSILGIQSHYSLPLLQTLLSPGKKIKTESMKHAYAIGYPEPLVHFALCSGAYSDPAVRAYRAKDVFNNLKLAKDEFAHASIHVHKETKLVLPKIFSYFAKDMSLDGSGLLKVLRECLPGEGECNAVTNCMNGISGPPDKNIHWLPQSSAFRYIIHRQLAQEIISSL